MTNSKQNREHGARGAAARPAGSEKRGPTKRRREAQDPTRAHAVPHAEPVGANVASLVISWNPQVPLPRNWPYPTHVVEVLPGSSLPWLASNGGYENYVANRWGCGSWVLREVAHNARSLSEVSLIVPSRPPRRRAEPTQRAPQVPSDPHRISDKAWAKYWAGTFVEELLTESPDTDAVRVYRIVVEELVANADLVRDQSFQLQLALTESVVRRANLTSKVEVRSADGRFSRRLPTSVA